jgi:formylmethanofuran--tetrahydromethanopterin N-formyltransferase
MANLKIKGVEIIETFAEAFPMVGTRIIITAPTQKWALIAAQTMTGFATSVIACGAEAGIERLVPAEETLDGRPGVAVLLFTMDVNKLQTQLRADEPRLSLLRRARRRKEAQARLFAPLLR